MLYQLRRIQPLIRAWIFDKPMHLGKPWGLTPFIYDLGVIGRCEHGLMGRQSFQAFGLNRDYPVRPIGEHVEIGGSSSHQPVRTLPLKFHVGKAESSRKRKLGRATLERSEGINRQRRRRMSGAKLPLQLVTIPLAKVYLKVAKMHTLNQIEASTADVAFTVDYNSGGGLLEARDEGRAAGL